MAMKNSELLIMICLMHFSKESQFSLSYALKHHAYVTWSVPLMYLITQCKLSKHDKSVSQLVRQDAKYEEVKAPKTSLLCWGVCVWKMKRARSQ